MIRSITRHSLIKKGAAIIDNRGSTPILSVRSLANNVYAVMSTKKGKGRICIIRKLGGIGDVLMCTPTLRQLKLDFPEAELTFAIDMHSTDGNNYFELVKNAPFIDKIIDARYVQESNYDVVVDITSVCIRYEHSGLPIMNRIDIFAKSCGIQKLLDAKSWYAVDEKERIFARNFLKEKISGEKIVFLHTASMEAKRCWPIEKYLQIVEAALRDKLPVKFLVMDFNSKFGKWNQYSNCIVISDLKIRSMAALLEQSDFFIGPDSGPMHLAGALGINSAIAFGSIPPSSRINHYPSHQAFRMDKLSCIGCFYKACDIGVKCMKELDSIRIYDNMRGRLGI